MIASPIEFTPTLTIDLNTLKLTPEQFQEICDANRDLRLELSATGELGEDVLPGFTLNLTKIW